MHKAQEGKLTFRRLVFFCMGIWVCSARPGQFEYYRNYDDLEMHFRNDHVLCEHPDCLAKKFVVFASQVEIKVGFILTDSMPSFHSVTDIILVHFVVTCQTV
jgi:hypothetical protein